MDRMRMIQDIVSRQLGRQAHLEGATVAEREEDGRLDLQAGARPANRSGVATGRSVLAEAGDRVVVMTSGDNDKPVVLCDNPWLM